MKSISKQCHDIKLKWQNIVARAMDGIVAWLYSESFSADHNETNVFLDSNLFSSSYFIALNLWNILKNISVNKLVCRLSHMHFEDILLVTQSNILKWLLAG